MVGNMIGGSSSDPVEEEGGMPPPPSRGRTEAQESDAKAGDSGGIQGQEEGHASMASSQGSTASFATAESQPPDPWAAGHPPRLDYVCLQCKASKVGSPLYCCDSGNDKSLL